MADPSEKVRRGVKDRDEGRCVSCGSAWALTFQHRRAVGMGGSDVRPSYADGLAACGSCNGRFEGDMQTLALLNGWKVRRWVEQPELVPYYHAHSDAWYALSPDGPWRLHITRRKAMSMMRAVYGSDKKGGRS